MLKQLAVTMAALAACAAPAAAATYTIDPAHSSVAFSVRHLVTKVHGTFDKFKGVVNYDPAKPASWKADVEIDADSIDTKVAMRDNHLKSPEFFDVKKCPKLTFKSTKFEGTAHGGKLTGDLTMHCITKPVTLDVTVGGVVKDPGGNEHFGASATATLSRKEWGLNWNKAIEAGGTMVGDDVTLELDVEALPGTGKAR